MVDRDMKWALLSNLKELVARLLKVEEDLPSHSEFSMNI